MKFPAKFCESDFFLSFYFLIILALLFACGDNDEDEYIPLDCANACEKLNGCVEEYTGAISYEGCEGLWHTVPFVESCVDQCDDVDHEEIIECIINNSCKKIICETKCPYTYDDFCPWLKKPMWISGCE